MVTRFLGGLKEEIWSAIALHRPKYIDTASALAFAPRERIKSHRLLPTKCSYRSSMGEKSKTDDTDRAKLETSREDSKDKVADSKRFSHEEWLMF